MQLGTLHYGSPLGTLALSCSGDYITSLLFSELPPAPPKDDQLPLLQEGARQLDSYFKGTLKKFELPIKAEGTEFQQRVWTLLENIPYGKTISYQNLSRQYGDVKSIRAVAAANGKNKLAIIIPCHRVIGSNQSLTGYAGGIWRKKWLLEHETRFQTGVEQLQF
ncbi:MAG: methylated-DNA--[protein]-cysteine S-methyltransferase [Flavisolibacter sp.]